MNRIFKHIFHNKNIEYILLSSIIIGGFLVRLYKISMPLADWHSWRQADTSAVTRNFVKDGINLLLPKYDDVSSIQSRLPNPNGYRMVEFPIYNAIVAIIYKLFGLFSIEVWSRLITVTTSISTAILLYMIGKRFISTAGGILSAFFYLFVPFNIYFTRVILPDPLGVFFGVLALTLYVRFIDMENDIYLYISAVFFALMLLIKPYLGFYFVPAIYLAVEKFGLRRMFRRPFVNKIIMFSLISLLPFVMWRYWESRYPEGIPLFWWAFNGNGIRFRPAYWNWVFGERIGHLILGSFGIVPFIFGGLFPESKEKGSNFIRWFFVGVLIYVTVVASANVMHDYYQILTIPVIALMLACGSVYLWNQNVFNKIAARILLIFSIGIMLITGWYQVKGNYVINHPEIIEAGNAISKITPKDALIVAPYNGDTAFLYHTNRRGWPAVDDSIDNIIDRGADYYVSVDLNSADTINFERRFETIAKTKEYIILDLHKEIN